MSSCVLLAVSLAHFLSNDKLGQIGSLALFGKCFASFFYKLISKKARNITDTVSFDDVSYYYTVTRVIFQTNR